MTNVGSVDPGNGYWDIFDKLADDLTGLHADWKLFDQLYGKNAARVDLLNKVAVSFFHRLLWIMLRDVTLSICRFLDRPKMREDENLVLESLVDQLDPSIHASLRDDLHQRLEGIRDQARPLQSYRHKRVAHRDKQVAMETKSLPGISRQLVEDVLGDLRDCMNAAQLPFRDGATAWEHTMMLADGDHLILALKRSVAYTILLKEGTVGREHPLPFAEA